MKMDEIEYLVPQMVMVGAFGRNSGKTTLACALIENLAQSAPVVGVKVICVEEPGRTCHRGGKGCGLCGGLTAPFDLLEETGSQSGKDTARMLGAGAEKAFLLRCKFQYMGAAARHFLGLIPTGTLVVCESNRLRFAVKPGVFLLCTPGAPKGEEEKPWAAQLLPRADAVLPFGEKPPVLQLEKLAGGALALSLLQKGPAAGAEDAKKER